MRRTPVAATLLAIAVVALASACARSVAVQSEPGPTYIIDVANPMPHSMIVSYDDGSGPRLLGTVPANGRERFIIAGSARPNVTILATDERQAHRVSKAVTLSPGTATEVSLTM